MVVVLRANQIYSRPGKPGKFLPANPISTTRSRPSSKGQARSRRPSVYTERSLNKLIEEGIAEAAAERTDKSSTKATEA